MGKPLNPLSILGIDLDALPPAPVVVGAATRLLQRAICEEVARRGPSAKYMQLMREAGYDDDFSARLHAAIFEVETGAER